MIVETFNERPALARVRRFKQRGRFHSAIQRVGFVWVTQSYLPDLFQRKISISSGVGGRICVLHGCRRGWFVLGKLDAVGFRLGPGFPEVIRRTQVRTPVGAVDCSPETLAAVAVVVSKGINCPSGEIGSTNFPLLSLLV